MPETNSTTERVVVSQGLSNLASAMEGLPGAAQILKSTSDAAVKEGLIKTVTAEGNDLTKIPETVKTSTIPKMRTEEQTAGNTENTNTATADATENTSVENKDTKTADEDNSADEETNPLLKSLNAGKKAKAVVFENFDQIKATAKKEFGIDIKDEKDFGKVFSSSKKWREDAAKVPDLESKVAQFNEIFENMPDSLLNSVKDYFDAKPDWDKHITNKPKFDFSKPVEKQKVEELVNYYFPGDFTEDDFKAEEKGKDLKIAEKAAKDRFNSDKLGLENDSAAQMRLSEARIEGRKTSIASSLTTLKQSFPEIDKSEEKRLTKILESGDINSLFINKDGSYKPGAAKMLFLAEYGEGAIENLMKVSAKRAESKANEDILTRGADTAKPNNGGAVADKNAIEVKKVIEGMTQGLNTKRTY